MRNFTRYSYGITIGMLGEYLYGVQCSIYPAIILGSVILLMILDLAGVKYTKDYKHGSRS